MRLCTARKGKKNKTPPTKKHENAFLETMYRKRGYTLQKEPHKPAVQFEISSSLSAIILQK